MVRIAIAEPDPAAADVLLFAAQRRGHQPIAVPSTARLLERLPFEPAAIVASVDSLDDESMDEMAMLRQQYPAACIIVTCERPGANGAFEALKAGASDLVRSPYNPYELIHRIETWLASRAPERVAATAGVQLGDLEIDLDAHSAMKGGRAVPLTKLERRLLYCLCEHHPSLATIDRLLAFGWESLDDPDAGLLKTHISHIRRKLRDAGGAPFEIVSHQTVGYSLRVNEEALPDQLAS